MSVVKDRQLHQAASQWWKSNHLPDCFVIDSPSNPQPVVPVPAPSLLVAM
ncbi:uncharacterized protein RAG0_07640 [Rhynchosporium agropyri]|uniref:Uncharacterized protein n=2 Tax=Rhynchosporium TaxID=38037 RepID=A0A1E1KMI4_9HELO|nr:uncharacterized protein RCO7_14349 [Rhynchosporium commune]CZS99191.1 uncharacterized protein RAG0_07640 [Rhynchosporium agropyri]